MLKVPYFAGAFTIPEIQEELGFGYKAMAPRLFQVTSKHFIAISRFARMTFGALKQTTRQQTARQQTTLKPPPSAIPLHPPLVARQSRS